MEIIKFEILETKLISLSGAMQVTLYDNRSFF